MAMLSQKLHALVYADVDMNLIDGSSIWLASTAECLVRAGVDVTVLLKAPIVTGRLLEPLNHFDSITLIEQTSQRLTPDSAARELVALNRQRTADLVIVRGLAACVSAVEQTELCRKVWSYLTDIPQSATALSATDSGDIEIVVRGSRRVLCQTPEMRSFIEVAFPNAQGKTTLLEPIIPDPQLRREVDRGDSTLSLVYSGKFALDWNTWQMLELPATLRDRGVTARLECIGDKIHDGPDGYRERMMEGLKGTPGVVWHGGLPRDAALDIVSRSDIGLSWRSPRLLGSLELSTKVLEYASMGVPPLLNRTPMHERLLGADYPLFAERFEDVIDVLTAVAENPPLVAAARDHVRQVARHFTMSSASKSLGEELKRAFPGSRSAPDRKVKVVVAGHDLRFMRGIVDLLVQRKDLEVRIDEWSRLAEHDPVVSEALVEWADVIVCEWAGHNAIWYSQRKRAEQCLIVRLHRFELTAGWMAEIDATALDAVVCVNDHYADLVRTRTGWNSDVVHVISNAVDRRNLEREKYSSCEFRLGLLGIVPTRKRPDRAIEILRCLRRIDGRFRLSIKSRMPWEYEWVWRRVDERAYFRQVFESIATDHALRSNIVFEPYGGDVAAWFQQIGWILSVSDDESFHLAPAEGMASGAVPALLDWPGAHGVYPSTYIHSDEQALVESIADTTISGSWDRASHDAAVAFPERFDVTSVERAWYELIRALR